MVGARWTVEIPRLAALARDDRGLAALARDDKASFRLHRDRSGHKLDVTEVARPSMTGVTAPRAFVASSRSS